MDFDPELTFEAAVQDFHNATAFLGDNPERVLAAAQVQALLVIAHQLGAVARHYEHIDHPPYVLRDDGVHPLDGEETEADALRVENERLRAAIEKMREDPRYSPKDLVGEVAAGVARWARQL